MKTKDRVKLNLKAPDEAVEMISVLYRMPECHFSVYNAKNTKRLDARSYMGLVYMAGSREELFLENDTKPGEFPDGIKKFLEMED